MTITIKIAAGNAAFVGDDKEGEVLRILQHIVDSFPILARDRVCKLWDVNGNTVGSVKVSGK